MLRQFQHQKLIQKLSPQQIQLMKLLQVPTASLEERIKEELEGNPALDLISDQPTEKKDEEYEDPFESIKENEKETVETDDIDLSDYLRTESESLSEHRFNEDYDDDDEPQYSPVRVEHTFHDYLSDQLGMLSLEERSVEIAKQIIGSIDDDGYLRREPIAIADDLAFNRNIITEEQEVVELIEKIQEFDPAGVGAENLQECLLLQLKRLDKTDPNVICAIEILSKHFDEFTKKHFDKIKQRLKIEDQDIRDAMNVILKLTPKPGSAFASSANTSNYIIPDFFIFNNNGILELSLNARNAPELRISDGYREMLTAFDRSKKKNKSQKEAVLFIKQKIDSAKWFIDAIKQRQHTLLITMNAIMDYQYDFFLTGDDGSLKPMILKDIADITEMDISTISRVANSKYVQTEYGVFLLKHFFSEGMVTESGEEVSTMEIKKFLMEIVDGENKQKPYSDEKLMTLLSEKGYNVARRTVSKYREQLNIPVARLRREA